MIRLLKFAWSYYRLYKLERKIEQSTTLVAERDALRLALKSGYANEIEFAARLKEISKVVDKPKMKKMVEESFAESRRVQEEVGKVVFEADVSVDEEVYAQKKTEYNRKKREERSK